jgi:hypothetical protein
VPPALGVVTGEVVGESAVAAPCEFVAVTATASVAPVSSLVGV